LKIKLYVNKKIGYSYYMEFVGNNHKRDDCMIVALHNACLGAGRKSTYKKVYDLSIKRGWYKEGQGFLCKFLDEAFDALKLSGNVVEICPKTIWRSCFNENKVYLFIRPSTYEMFPGHAMVAVKGEKGVAIHNPYDYKTGWRTLQRAIEKGDKYVAIEVSKS
jgi:hypothetical protein